MGNLIIFGFYPCEIGINLFLQNKLTLLFTIEDNHIEWIDVDFGDEDSSEDDELSSLDKAFIFTKVGTPLMYGKSRYRLIEKILSGEIEELSKDDKVVFQPISDKEIDDVFK